MKSSGRSKKDEVLLEQVDWDLLKSRKRDATALASFFFVHKKLLDCSSVAERWPYKPCVASSILVNPIS